MSNYMKGEFIDLGEHSAFMNVGGSVAEISRIVRDLTSDRDISVETLNKGSGRGYVPWGEDNKFPYHFIEAVRNNVVMSQNKFFNSLTCYGSGLTYKHRDQGKKLEVEVTDFFKYNRISKYFMEQCMDMKNFLLTATVLILSNDASKIVKLAHKEIVHCRLETCNPKTGKVEYLFYKNWKNDQENSDPEVIPVLDYDDPLGELEYLFGKKRGSDGLFRDSRQIAQDTRRKFVMINKFPTVGDEKYYPTHPSIAVFYSKWYEYSALIPLRKLAKLKNLSPVRYLVEINDNYLPKIFAQEGITTEEGKIARAKQLKEDIKNFLTGIENSNKMWVSGFYMDPNGKEVSDIHIKVIDTTKEGGDLIEDSAEANNYLCYADSVHPALIGANPGKTQGSHSGSVQRELFTMKQSLEKPYHDFLLEPFYVIREYNKWKDVVFDVPVITLTTLDEGKDAEENTLREQNNN